MPSWKKVLVSGSNAILNQVTASGGFSGDGSGLTSITADTALRLSLFFGNSAKFWLGLQDDYDLEEQRRKIGKDLKSIKNYNA